VIKFNKFVGKIKLVQNKNRMLVQAVVELLKN